MELIPFIPKTESYIIYHPKNFHVEESNDNIVSIVPDTETENPQTMSISSFSSDSIVTFETLHYFIKEIAENYKIVESSVAIKTENGICLRGIYTKDNINWIWILKAKEKKIVAISIHSNLINSQT